jgi:pantoate--beta-alanine ligase
MERASTRVELRRLLTERGAGRVALVPTLGALHAGHLALLEAAKAEGATVVLSVFVNPIQFDSPRDLVRYPRRLAEDARLATPYTDLLFAPAIEEVYPPGYATYLDPADTGAEGRARPGHFRGVATVVLRLLRLVEPDVVYFGLKDARQLAVVRRLVADLALPVTVRAVPVVRDPDGLALSSRNERLMPDEREQALELPRALLAARDASDPVAAASRALAVAPGVELEYVEVVELAEGSQLTAAVRVGAVRLLDAVPLA